MMKKRDSSVDIGSTYAKINPKTKTTSNQNANVNNNQIGLKPLNSVTNKSESNRIIPIKDALYI